jgi:hypothetical protein
MQVSKRDLYILVEGKPNSPEIAFFTQAIPNFPLRDAMVQRGNLLWLPLYEVFPFERLQSSAFGNDEILSKIKGLLYSIK